MLKVSKALLLTITLVATFSILLAGCGGDSVTPTTSSTPVSGISGKTVSTTATTQPKSLTVEEIALNSVTATEKIKSLKFDMDMSLLFNLGMSEKKETMNMQQSATCSVNIPEKQMAMIMDMVMTMPEQGEQNMSAEIYTLNGWMYMKANVPGVGDQWSKMKLTNEMWAKQSQLSSMTDFLKSPVNMELAGSENIRGVDCYILKITPDMKSLSSWMSGQMPGGQSGVNLDELGMSQMFENFSIKEWVAKNNYLLAKQEIKMKFDNTSAVAEGTRNTFDQMAMDLNASLTYFDYGKPVTIQLPSEALQAREIATPAQ